MFNFAIKNDEVHMKSSLLQTLIVSTMVATSLASLIAAEPEPLTFTIQRSIAHNGFDGETCWVHARAGAIPPQVTGNDSASPLVVMTMQKLLLTGSDVFYEINSTITDDLAMSWSPPAPQAVFSRQLVALDSDLPTGAQGAKHLLMPGDETTVCDFTPQWHTATGRLLGIGQTVWYRDNHVMSARPRGIAYAVFDAVAKRWNAWDIVELPNDEKFQNAGAGSVQRVDLAGGDVLVPIYFKVPRQTQYQVTVCRCRFDGHRLFFVEHGNEMTVPVKRGLYEPSLAKFGNRFFLTLRNDDYGYVCSSDDGLRFDTPRKWLFDDGEDLGNYNTQQHWVTHRDGLFLVYTRRGANNDHVFRHRAPLLIARVDPLTLRVIRSSERVLVPERGARLGNFGVVNVSETETWVTAAEWMQPPGVEKHGSNNSIHIAKLRWNRPNTCDADFSSNEDTIQSYFKAPMILARDFGTYTSPLRFTDGSNVETADDWNRRRKEILDDWNKLLGEWPPLLKDQQLQIVATEDRGEYLQHHVRFRWTPDETTNGYLLLPKSAGLHPAVVTVYYEPETAIGLGKPDRDFAQKLVRRGFVVLSIGTTEATQSKIYSLYHPILSDADVAPLSMLAYAAANAWHVLANRDDVDAKRIGIVGHSFGGKWAMFASCLFDKYACAAWSDPGIVFDESRESVNYWEPWYLGYHRPPWRPRGRITSENPARGLYVELHESGRDLHELHALMAPRPFLVSGGSEDPLIRWKALNHTVAVNRLLGFEDRVAMTNRPDHSPNAESNEVIYAFFEHFLNSSR